MGPLLYIIYVNDLPLFLKKENIKIITYADDTSIIIKGKTIEELKNQADFAISVLTNWFNANTLYLNISKTNYLHFKTSRNKNDITLNVQINNEILNKVASIKFLGVWLNDTVDWSTHCEKLSARLRQICFMFNVLKSQIPIKTLIMLYYAQVFSRINYGITLWGNSKYSRDVFIIQKRILRIMANIRQTQSCRPIFKQFEILPLSCIYILECLKSIKNNADQCILNSDVHSYCTRDSLNIRTPKHNLSFFEQGPTYWGHKFYNKLPSNIKDIKNTRTFLKACKAMLNNKCYYSCKEYLKDTT